jgi:hypothetical protein
VLTTPAYLTGNLLADVAPDAKELLNIFYPPVGAVILVYPNEAFKVRKFISIFHRLQVISVHKNRFQSLSRVSDI